MIRYLAPIIVFVIMIPIFVVGLDRDPRKLPSTLIDSAAPQYSLPSVKNPELAVGSANYAGKMALVNVWATWCGGCRQEHDYLLELSERNTLPIYGLNWRDRRPEAQRWLNTLKDPYVVSAYDEDGRVGIDWGVYGAPETFLIAEDGTVLHKHMGPLDERIWQRDFVPAINASKGQSR